MKKLRNLLQQTRAKVNLVGKQDAYVSNRAEREITLRPHAMHFQVYNANGGWIVQYTYYDEKKDENVSRLYVVPDEEDLADRLSKIINFELLKS